MSRIVTDVNGTRISEETIGKDVEGNGRCLVSNICYSCIYLVLGQKFVNGTSTILSRRTKPIERDARLKKKRSFNFIP
jgi:hypothetical protein